MAEERSEGATTEGPSVTSTVDAKKCLPRLGDAANVPILVLLPCLVPAPRWRRRSVNVPARLRLPCGLRARVG
jgi:hypothetical protein